MLGRNTVRKRKSFLIFIILVALTSVPATNAVAGTDYLFGPSQYLRTTTKTTDLYVETFPATPGEARLVVENGDENGRLGVGSARILLNGKEIIGSENFTATCMYPSCKMVEPVFLATENTISIELIEGRKNSRLTVCIVWAPSVNIDANPKTIQTNGESILTWSSVNIESLTIIPGYHRVGPDGSMSVRPEATTNYTIEGVGRIDRGFIGDTVTDSVTVVVIDSQLVTLSANPQVIEPGGTSTLTWTSTDMDSCIIEPDIGPVGLNGSIEVRPSETTTYTITAAGSGVSCTDAVTVTVGPSLTFGATPSSVRPNGTCTLAWAAPGADYCVINPDIGGFGPEGSIEVTLSETTTFTIMAFGTDGYSTGAVTVTVEGPPLPTVSMSATRERICESYTYPNTLTWSSTDADSCVIEPGIGVVGPSGSVGVSPTITTTYTITASNPEGSASKSFTVYVCEPPPPVASLSADPYAIYKGWKTYLTWSATNTTSGGCRLTPGNFYSNGSLWHYSFWPSETTTYTVTATGPGGTDSVSVMVVVIDPPALTITADSVDILPGQSTILTWDAPDADTCRIEPGIGIVGSSGSIEVWPSETTTYTITVDGPIGPYHKTVRVNIIPPTVNIVAAPEAILPGGTSTLSWAVTNADSCTIAPDIGDVDLNGSMEVSPKEDTRYTIQATNSGGTVTGHVDVHVIKPPTAEIWPSSGAIIQPGGSTALTWRTTDADSRVIEPDIGSVGPSGTIQGVSPTETTQYTITATGPLGAATDSCVVGVAHSSEIMVFDPGQYNRTGGKANLYTETFSASTGQSRLIVKNGAETGGSRITDAAILLNGVEIFSPSDFSASIYQLEKIVTLASANTLSITLKRGEKNSYLSILVIQDQLPAVSISADPVTVVKGDECMLSWTSTNAYICRITPDINNVMPNGSIKIAPANTTTYTITATGSGGAATDAITIIAVDPPPVVDIAADPEQIKPGQTSLLTWTSENADSCAIEPGIGAVGPEGSIEVSPTETTTYTITASGSGGSTSNTVTVSVYPLPIVTISADPAYIQPGGDSTLVWTSSDADSCIIEPGIGSVALSGTTDVSPSGTTTYTITAQGPGGSTAESVTVSVIDPPTVSISAEPQTVYTGDTCTLSWTSANADACVIEPGIGTVELTGTMEVIPTETNTYTITATNPIGSATDAVTVNYIYSPIQLSITSPGDGDGISYPYTLVRGTVSDASGADEIGITVNGIIALVHQNEFAANHVPFENGENTITVVATDSMGNVRSKLITVFADIDVDHIWILPDVESGLLPFETELTIDGSFNFQSPNVYHTGGSVDYLETRDNTFVVRLNDAGICYFYFEATDDQYNAYADTVAVMPYSAAAIDSLLQTRWIDHLDHLNNGDIQSALSLMHEKRREDYEIMFNALLPQLPNILSTNRDFTLVSSRGNDTHYELTTYENGKNYVYPVDFLKANNGLWKILDY